MFFHVQCPPPLLYCSPTCRLKIKTHEPSVTGNGLGSLWTLRGELKLHMLGEHKITSMYTLQAGMLVRMGKWSTTVMESCAPCVVPKKNFVCSHKLELHRVFCAGSIGLVMDCWRTVNISNHKIFFTKQEYFLERVWRSDLANKNTRSRAGIIRTWEDQ